MADAHPCHIADHHRRAAIGAEDRVADVIHRVDQADAAHHRRLRPDIHRLAAHIDVGVVQRRQNLRHGQAEMRELALVDRHFVGFRLAPAIHVDHARHRAETALQHPVLDGLEIGDRVVRRPDDPVTQDLADRAFGRYLRRDPVRQRRQLRQPVDHPLLRLLVSQVVGELHPHVGQAEYRNGPQRGEVRNARHLHFDRNGDVALDLLGGLAGVLGDDFHQRRHRIGIGLDVQPQEGRTAGGEHESHEHDHQHTVLQGKRNDVIHLSRLRPPRGR